MIAGATRGTVGRDGALDLSRLFVRYKLAFCRILAAVNSALQSTLQSAAATVVHADYLPDPRFYRGVESGRPTTTSDCIYRAGGRDSSESRQGENAEVERAKGATTTEKRKGV